MIGLLILVFVAIGIYLVHKRVKSVEERLDEMSYMGKKMNGSKKI